MKQVYVLKIHHRKSTQLPLSFTLKDHQPAGQGLKHLVCFVYQYLTLELEEPANNKLIISEARKSGSFGRSPCNWQETQRGASESIQKVISLLPC